MFFFSLAKEDPSKIQQQQSNSLSFLGYSTLAFNLAISRFSVRALTL